MILSQTINARPIHPMEALDHFNGPHSLNKIGEDMQVHKDFKKSPSIRAGGSGKMFSILPHGDKTSSFFNKGKTMHQKAGNKDAMPGFNA